MARKGRGGSIPLTRTMGRCGEIGRRAGFRVRWPERVVEVRLLSPAPMEGQPDGRRDPARTRVSYGLGSSTLPPSADGGSSRLATAPGLNPGERKPWEFDSLILRRASMVKLADAPGSNPGGPEGSCRFKSCCSHQGRAIRWLATEPGWNPGELRPCRFDPCPFRRAGMVKLGSRAWPKPRWSM